jgi:anti-sigma factor (TIGR02949 family)
VTCREAIAVLADYLESTMDERTGEQLEAHLADCDECQAYLGTYRRTTQVVAAAGRLEMPDELRSRLRAFLLERLGET